LLWAAELKGVNVSAARKRIISDKMRIITIFKLVDK